ncbi:MAG: hypothetical protein WCF13_05560 [Stellaceae bacterium]
MDNTWWQKNSCSIPNFSFSLAARRLRTCFAWPRLPSSLDVSGFIQEGRAQATLDALKSRVALVASAQRDGKMAAMPATTLVSDGLVKVSLGSVVAADVRLTDGAILLDQSMLTGQSFPIEAGAGIEAYAGALVRRSEAEACLAPKRDIVRRVGELAFLSFCSPASTSSLQDGDASDNLDLRATGIADELVGERRRAVRMPASA